MWNLISETRNVRDVAANMHQDSHVAIIRITKEREAEFWKSHKHSRYAAEGGCSSSEPYALLEHWPATLKADWKDEEKGRYTDKGAGEGSGGGGGASVETIHITFAPRIEKEPRRRDDTH